MNYISSETYSASISELRLKTLDRDNANDFELHKLKRLYLLSKLGEITNDIHRLEKELLDIVDRRNAGNGNLSAENQHKRAITHLVNYRGNILRGLKHEDKFLSVFGDNKPYIPARVYFEQLESRLSNSESMLESLLIGRRYILSRIGETTEVLNKIDRVIVLCAQRNERDEMMRYVGDRSTYLKKLRLSYQRLRGIDKRISETKK